MFGGCRKAWGQAVGSPWDKPPIGAALLDQVGLYFEPTKAMRPWGQASLGCLGKLACMVGGRGLICR